MRILRLVFVAVTAVLLLEGFGLSLAIAAGPTPLFAPVYAQSRAYRKAVRYAVNHPFSLGSPVAVPVQVVPVIPVRNVPTPGYYSANGYFYRASYASPVMTGSAMNVPELSVPETVSPPVGSVPVEPEIIPAPRPERFPSP